MVDIALRIGACRDVTVFRNRAAISAHAGVPARRIRELNCQLGIAIRVLLKTIRDVGTIVDSIGNAVSVHVAARGRAVFGHRLYALDIKSAQPARILTPRGVAVVHDRIAVVGGDQNVVEVGWKPNVRVTRGVPVAASR